MIYTWYSKVSKSNEITQGDLIHNCLVPLLSETTYNALYDEDMSEEESNDSVDVQRLNLVVLSQACDLKNDKIDTVVLCAFWKLEDLIKKNKYYHSRKSIESLSQGKEPAYHLLNKYSSPSYNQPYLVVDFHRIYTLPKKYLEEVALEQEFRLRINPPYREHLSQAFARYFMRVGLPSDISKDDLKKKKDEIVLEIKSMA